jgi:hypothetical protein
MFINETCKGCASSIVEYKPFDFTGCIRSYFKGISDKCPCKQCLVKSICLKGCPEYNLHIEHIASLYEVTALSLDKHLLEIYEGYKNQKEKVRNELTG